MKLAIVLATLFIACSPAPSPEPSGCSKDSDCKGTRVCQNGSCVDQGGPTPTPTSSGTPGGQDAGPFPTTGNSACGDVDVACNCNPTSAYPGQITQTPLCQSGYHQFQVCGQCQGGGAAWLTQCYCQ